MISDASQAVSLAVGMLELGAKLLQGDPGTLDSWVLPVRKPMSFSWRPLKNQGENPASVALTYIMFFLMDLMSHIWMQMQLSTIKSYALKKKKQLILSGASINFYMKTCILRFSIPPLFVWHRVLF